MTESISREEIDRIKKDFVLRNTLLSPVKVAAILDCGVRKVYRLVESGDLEEGNDTPGRQGMRVTALSVEQYRLRITQATQRAAEGMP